MKYSGRLIDIKIYNKMPEIILSHIVFSFLNRWLMTRLTSYTLNFAAKALNKIYFYGHTYAA